MARSFHLDRGGTLPICGMLLLCAIARVCLLSRCCCRIVDIFKIVNCDLLCICKVDVTFRFIFDIKKCLEFAQRVPLT